MSYVKPKKWLGQHFLTDGNIALKIVESLHDNAVNVLEIGPGTGVLTHFLLQKNFNLKLIEVDPESIIYLKTKYKISDLIIDADFLKYDLTSIFNNNFSIIGNFPYSISSQIVFKVLENKELVDELVGMFQKEVAARICATNGNKVYGILSVLVQAFYDTTYLFTVEPHVFKPPPKVMSGVIRLKRKANFKIDCNEKQFFQIVKKAFNQRRKTLRNALKGVAFCADFKEEMLNKRAEQLSVDDFIYLTQSVKQE